MRLGRWARRSWLIAAVVAAVATAGAGLAEAGDQYPVTPNVYQGIAQSAANPSAPPPGVNTSGCKPTSAHPRPVVLITGTFGNMTDDWAGLGPTLANQGYCVYSTPIGANPNALVQTTGPVVDSAKRIADFVSQVQSQTGAGQVDLVGHSQGGLIAEYYTKLLGGAPRVHTLVGLSPPTRGTTLDGLAALARFFPGAPELVGAACPACADQMIGSSTVKAMNAGPVSQPGVDYTIIETRTEFVVTPPGSAFIPEPGVHNVWVQDSCPTDTVDHVELPYDRAVQTLVANALDPAHPRSVQCS